MIFKKADSTLNQLAQNVSKTNGRAQADQLGQNLSVILIFTKLKPSQTVAWV
jgi:hypothetical protein